MYGNGTRILQTLPRNQWDRLSLKGFGVRESGFWRVHDLMGNSEVDLISKLEVLRGFRNLNHLNLRRCPDSVDDRIMQFILSKMTSLEVLEVSHCSRLTDVGFVGTLRLDLTPFAM